MKPLQGISNLWHNFARDDLVHFHESVELVDAFSINSRESYAEMDWGIEVILKALREATSPTYFLALVKAFKRVGQLSPDVGIAEPRNNESLGCGTDRQQDPVLIGIGQYPKCHQALGKRQIVSVIRLTPFNSLEELRRESLKQWVRFANEQEWIVVDRKLKTPTIAERLGSDFPHEVVESSSQMVNALRSEKAEGGVGIFGDVGSEDIAVALSIEVRRGAIRLTTEKLSLLGLEVVEVNPCSIKPPEWPVYWVHSTHVA